MKVHIGPGLQPPKCLFKHDKGAMTLKMMTTMKASRTTTATMITTMTSRTTTAIMFKTTTTASIMTMATMMTTILTTMMPVPASGL